MYNLKIDIVMEVTSPYDDHINLLPNSGAYAVNSLVSEGDLLALSGFCSDP